MGACVWQPHTELHGGGIKRVTILNKKLACTHFAMLTLWH